MHIRFNPMTYSRPLGTGAGSGKYQWCIGGFQKTGHLFQKEHSLPLVLYFIPTIKNLSTNERYIDVVHLPGNVDTSTLPAEVRKYLINVDGSDAGAYEGTITAGWVTENNQKKYRKSDGTYVTNGWLNVDDESYYMDENGVMLADTITPDGVYVNANGEKQTICPAGTRMPEAGTIF